MLRYYYRESLNEFSRYGILGLLFFFYFDFLVSLMLNLLSLVLSQILSIQTFIVSMSFDLCQSNILRTSAFNYKLLYSTPKFNKLFIIFQGSLFLCQKDIEKALFTKFAKALKVLDVVILYHFIQEGLPSITRRSIHYITLAINTGFVLSNILGTFSFSIFF